MDAGGDCSGFACTNGIAIATKPGIALDIYANEAHQQPDQNDVWNTKCCASDPVEHRAIIRADTNATRPGNIKRYA